MPKQGHDYGVDAATPTKDLNWANIHGQRNANPVFIGRYFNPHVSVAWVDGESANVKAANPDLAYVFPMQNPGARNANEHRMDYRLGGLHHIMVEIDGPRRRSRAGAVSISGGAVTAIAIYDGGVGYTAAPAVSISSTAGAGAAAKAVINAEGVVTGINITTGGAGYKSDVRIIVSIAAPPAGTTARAGAVTVSPSGSITAIAIANGGAGYKQAPAVVIRGGDSNAKANTTINAGKVTAINVTDGGSGYREQGGILVKIKAPPPAVTAKAGQVTVSAAGAITKIAVKKGGSRYVTAPGVSISSDSGSGAKANATINAKGAVTAINVTDGGSGYKANGKFEVKIDPPPPAVHARAGTVTLSAAGGITNIAVANGGAGYKTRPDVTIFGAGAGATATSTIDAQGVVTAINVTAAGNGYSLPNPDPGAVRKWGEADAKAVCNRVWDVVKGGELTLPDSRSVIVYLDIEAGVTLSPDYWHGWASGVYWFSTGFFQWPFYAGLYCMTQHNPEAEHIATDPHDQLHRIPSDDVIDGLTLPPNSCSSRCYGIFATNPQVDNRFDVGFQPDWENRFEDWPQTVRVIFGLFPWDFKVKVVLWQYGMQQGNPNPSPPAFNALGIDLDEASPDGEATRRMLKIP